MLKVLRRLLSIVTVDKQMEEFKNKVLGTTSTLVLWSWFKNAVFDVNQMEQYL